MGTLRSFMVILGLTLAFVVVVSGCDNGVVDASTPSVPSTTVGDDSTAAPVVSEGDVVFEVTSEALLKYDFQTVTELNAADVVDVILRGQVVATMDVYEQHQAFRILTVQAEEVYKGEISNPITVYEDGGLIPLKVALPDFAGRLDISTLSEDQLERGHIRFTFGGARLAEVGDDVVLYLRKNPNASQGDSYQLIMGPYSRFTLDKSTGSYIRAAKQESPLYESVVSKDSMESALEKLRSK